MWWQLWSRCTWNGCIIGNPSEVIVQYNIICKVDVCVLSILVRLPREAALDSQLLVAVSRLSRKKAQSLQAEFVTFEPVEYAEKLVGFVRVIHL